MDSKNFNLNSDNEFYSNPKKIQFLKDIVKDAYIQYIKLNSFCVFKSIDEIYYLIYTTKYISIIFYNLINNKKISEIKYAHPKFITSFRHYFDDINKRDLIISISLENHLIKLWNVKNLECLLIINKINEGGVLLSACFLNDNKNIFIITSNQKVHNVGPIKFYDLKGNIVKKLDDYKINTYYIDTY